MWEIVKRPTTHNNNDNKNNKTNDPIDPSVENVQKRQQEVCINDWDIVIVSRQLCI